ncbi:ABC transporter ATP-binding protein [Ornithinimicrobium murale]|uniref:ABC transporter ATP-binding protein n=1 Tax=Ornithinimicrobium murale TaxID=1050153 RepID=UPI000E0DA4C1|nr:ABC transporter ATP-binding protein [Ornithinimicrobium murale]
MPPVTSPAAATGYPIVVAEDLTKVYGQNRAVDGITFSITSGESFGLLGPNGAGKSTTMRMIGGTLTRSGGTMRVAGLDPAERGPEVRAHLGVVPQQDNLDEELTVRDNLIVYGRYFGLPHSYLRTKADELIEFAQLTDKAKSKTTALSGGMKRRLTIARALVNEPKLLLLDEPTTGLDPQARHVLWDRLFRLKEVGVTLVVTTHFMDEAEQLCDRLIVIDHGRIMAEGSPRSLIRDYATREVLEVRFGAQRNAAVVDQLADVATRLEVLPDRILVYTDDGEAALEEISARGLTPITSLVRRSSLEDVFLRLTGRTLVD